MAKKMAISVSLIFIILLDTTCLKPASVHPEKYVYNAFPKLPSARAKEYKLRFVDSSGKPIRNKKMHLKQIRQSFMLNNREGFTNYIWLETTDKKLRGFVSKRIIKANDIIAGLGLDKLAREGHLDMYLDLRIPVSFVSEGGVPEGTSIAEYESVEIYALKRYGEAFRITGIKPDYIHILPEFNQKMNLDLHFNTAEAVAFADRYIRTARELFPESRLVVDLGPLYCFDDFHYPVGPDGDCIHELRMGLIPDHLDFIEILEDRESPYDVIGIEYQPGSHHSTDPRHLRIFFDKIGAFGKPIFIWEFWVLSGEITAHEPNYGMYVFNRPDGGWTENYQKTMFEEMLGYINSNPQIIGLTQFGWKDGIKDIDAGPSGPYGMIREDGTKKPSYYVMRDWYNSWFTECDLATDSQAMTVFRGLPGRYVISKGFFHRKIIDIDENSKEIGIIF